MPWKKVLRKSVRVALVVGLLLNCINQPEVIFGDQPLDLFKAALTFIGYSRGGYKSLAVAVSTKDRTIAKGPEDGRLIRLQIGLEDTADLIEDVEQALGKIA